VVTAVSPTSTRARGRGIVDERGAVDGGLSVTLNGFLSAWLHLWLHQREPGLQRKPGV